MKTKIVKLLDSVSIKVILVIIILILPLNILTMVYTSNARNTIIDQTKEYIQRILDDNVQELNERIKMAKSFLTYVFIQVFRSDFGLFYQISKNSGALYPATRTIDVYVYQALMQNSDYAMSSAASVYQSVVGFVLCCPFYCCSSVRSRIIPGPWPTASAFFRKSSVLRLTPTLPTSGGSSAEAF